MENVYRFIVENVAAGKIEKQIAIDMIKVLQQEKKNGDDIAIIGLAAKIPMAHNMDEYWNDIRCRFEYISKFPRAREGDITRYLKKKGISQENIRYCDGAYLQRIDEFDYRFFKITPREATLMDPYQRLFLETVWHAFEDAGYGEKKIKGSNTGVTVGFASNLRDMYARLIYDDDCLDATAIVGNLSAILPSRISYILNLKGPSMIVDTACSSSLSALILACQALRNGDCDMAVAGAVKINLVPLDKANEKIGMESSDGRTRSFDEFSDGAGVGDGVIAVLLKPLSRALSDNDRIYGVIKGFGMNQDGNSAGITAPNPKAQKEVIIKAWEDAGINPETISYIEVHGTGTNLGDAIEIRGLTDAFRKYTDKRQFCAISSLKSNIGHLYEAAGLAGLVKAVLSLQNREIPAGVHFNRPNSAINFSDSPVYVNIRPREWEANGQPRRCGVSSFGISGTNCHVVLEEAPQLERTESVDGIHVLTLSAKSESALERIIEEYINYLSADTGLRIGDVCYTASTGRGHYGYRLTVRASCMDELLENLRMVSKASLTFGNQGVNYGYHKVVEDKKETIEGHEIIESRKRELSREAANKIQGYLETGRKDPEILDEICKLYIKGADIEWESIYDTAGLKVKLPVYPFERERCWIDVPDVDLGDIQNKEAGCYYTLGWKEEELMPCAGEKKRGAVVVIKDNIGISEGIIKSFRDQGREVYEIEIGAEFRKKDSICYAVGVKEDDYEKVLSDMKGKGLTQIIHLATITGSDEISSLEELENSQMRGVYSLFHLVRATIKCGMSEEIEIVLISNYVNEVTETEKKINPERNTLFGLGKVVRQEYSNVLVRCIDIDDECSIENVIYELKGNSGIYQTAYRQGKRYVEEFREVDLGYLQDNNISIKEDGVYLITGGTGGIGLEMAKLLAEKNKVRLALVNRHNVQLCNIMGEVTDLCSDVKVNNKIKILREIESSGSEVVLYSADVSNLEEMSTVIADLKKRFGRIDGIIHSAGIAGAGYIVRKNQQVFDSVLNTKVKGTWILDYLTKDEELDFFLLFSSAITVTGEAGQGDYVAANSYLDSFAAYRNKKGKRTLTINWVTWKSVGMSVEYGINIDTIFKALPTTKAIGALSQLLKKNINKILVGELNFDSEYVSIMDSFPFRLSEKLEYEINRIGKVTGSRIVRNGEHEVAILDKGQVTLLPRSMRGTIIKKEIGPVKLMGRDKTAYSDIEEKLANIYSNVLGFKELNIYDSFFELGGDSILLGKIHVEIEKEFPGFVKMVELFEYTSIAKLSQFIMKKINKDPCNNDDCELEELRNMLEDVSKGSLTVEGAIKKLD